MSRWRSSPRFRRRALWSLALLAAAGGIAALSLGMQNRGEFPEQHYSTRPLQVVPVPTIERLSRSQAADVIDVSSRFVRTAVVHKQMRSAYDLVGPELRGGLTRTEWSRGDNPVVPFPAVGIAGVNVAYSYHNDVALDLALIAKPGSDTVGKTFRIELKRTSATAPWHVVSWLPFGVSGSGNVRSIAKKQAALAAAEEQAGPTLGARWLAFPVALLTCVLLVPLGLGVRSWRANRRAEREYRRAHGLPSDL